MIENSQPKMYELLVDTSLYSGRVYFNPPNGVKLEYPCIVFALENAHTVHADGNPYVVRPRYTVTHIYAKYSDHSVTDALLDLPGSRFSRSYKADGLYHDVISITNT